MVAEHLRDHEFTDFQQLEPWRTLVPTVMAEVTRFTGQGLVAPHDADPDVLEARIRSDAVVPDAHGWRLEPPGRVRRRTRSRRQSAAGRGLRSRRPSFDERADAGQPARGEDLGPGRSQVKPATPDLPTRTGYVVSR